MKFLGCEICDLRPGFSIDQAPYIRELLRSHGTPCSQLNVVPCPRDWLSLEDDNGQVQSSDDDEIRQAQCIAGELLWITQRSRPDLAYHVSIIAWLTTRDAKSVGKSGQRILGFLQRAAGTRLDLRPTREGLCAFSDASFAFSGSRSHTAFAGGCGRRDPSAVG